MYPWETDTSDGSGATIGGSAWSEQHITLDVALGIAAHSLSVSLSLSLCLAQPEPGTNWAQNPRPEPSFQGPGQIGPNMGPICKP